jgi:hypothetical protein
MRASADKRFVVVLESLSAGTTGSIPKTTPLIGGDFGDQFLSLDLSQGVALNSLGTITADLELDSHSHQTPGMEKANCINCQTEICAPRPSQLARS